MLGIARTHGGGLQVESSGSTGSCFRVLLPASESPPQAAVAEAAGELVGQRRVLVIDDDAAVRDSTQRLLERSGYAVLTALDGASGVQTLRADPQAIDAVLLDLTMPGLSGEDTFRALRAIREDLPVILTSGYSDQDAATAFAEGLSAFIQKPYTQRALAAMIEEGIRSARSSSEGQR